MNENEPQDPEQKRKAAIELANAYRDMMAMFAWKHLQSVVISRIKADALKATDDRPIVELTLAEVAEARGVRKAFERIQTELDWILHGHEVITR